MYACVESYQRSHLNVCYIVPNEGYKSDIPVQLVIENNLSNISSHLAEVATETTRVHIFGWVLSAVLMLSFCFIIDS